MEDSTVVAEALVSLVRQTPTQKVTGVQLATLIRHRFPDFNPANHQCRNLRHFIRQYARQIQEIGRSGADIVYGISSEQQLATAPREPETGLGFPRLGRRLDPYVWKAFANPRSAYRVHANTETGELKSMLASYEALPPWVIVPSATEEVQLQIARDFVGGLHDPQRRAALGDLIGQPEWWTKFFPSTITLGLRIEWGAFRRRRLIEEFDKALTSLRVPGRPDVRPPDLQLPVTYKSPVTGAESSPKGDEQLRRVIINVIKRLPSADLRALRLPIGDVLDAIKDE